MDRKPIDEETALKLISCLESYNENRYFISEFKIEEGKKKKIGTRLLTEQDKKEEGKKKKIGTRLLTEQDKKEERELAIKMLNNKKLDYD